MPFYEDEDEVVAVDRKRGLKRGAGFETHLTQNNPSQR